VTALRIGTRGSALALWQARTVARLLGESGTTAELVVISTSGDRLQERPLSEDGGKRLFVKEIEDALARGDVDLAVHSAKDMPAVPAGGLGIAATLPREDPRDALVVANCPGGRELGEALAHLGEAPVVGTGSIRRIAQLTTVMPQARFAPIRGNVDTRLRKLDEGEFNALVLASAGMRRLGFGGRISAAVPIDDCVPAPGQGIVAVEIREADAATRERLRPLNDPAAWTALVAERAVVEALGGGCQLPLGAIASPDGAGMLQMTGVVSSPDGQRVVRRRASGAADAAAAVGRELAELLLDGGAAEILDAVRRNGR
jgi:hydroxymethylbilane synthase